MLLRRISVACLAVGFASLLALMMSAAPQEGYDRESYARDYVKFLVVQLDQWTKEFPREFNMALMKPPVDSTKLSASAKGGASELGDSIAKLAALSNAKDLMTNAEFRGELDKALSSVKELNLAMSTQRFPTTLQNDWDQIRSTLNNLARVYKMEMIAVLDAPGGGGGRGGGRGGRGGRGAPAADGATVAAVGPVAGGLAGYIVDLSCAKKGKGMWTNTTCVQRCIRDGDKIVLVTEEGKIYQISNQDKITPDSYGQVVTLLGKTDGDTITVESLK
jgi:hypothetical protein